MISYLKGKIILKKKDFVVLDVSGVGFKVFLGQSHLERIEKEQVLELYCFLSLKRDTIELYGFLDSDSLLLFEKLEEISGIGPKTALALASFGSLDLLKQAIEKKDREFLDKIKGIGRKKIQRIILELTGDLKKAEKGISFEQDEAFEALVSLGFPKQKVKAVLNRLPKSIKKTEEKISQALKMLGEGKV